jgi:hypothetical protein
VRATTPDGRVREVGPVDVGAGGVQRVEVSLEGGARLSGRVLTAAGYAVPGAVVAVAHAHGTFRRTATADAAGRFALEGLPSGSYAVLARGRGGAAVQAHAHLAPGGREDLTLSLEEAARLLVQVLGPDGRAREGATVVLRSGGRVVPTGPARTSARGEAVVEDVPLGEVDVVARTPDGEEGGARTAVTADGGRVVVAVAPRP